MIPLILLLILALEGRVKHPENAPSPIISTVRGNLNGFPLPKFVQF